MKRVEMKSRKTINVTQPFLPPFEEYVEEISSLWQTKWLTNMGEKHNKLTDSICDYLGVENASLFTNGHTALEMILEALELSGEVITTPYTFPSTVNAIIRSGLSPVFCDIDPVSWVIDATKIEDLITDKTCAIVGVHVYGQNCDVVKIEELAKKYNLKVVYDAAHAFGAKLANSGIGIFGDASMFSFHATKVFHTVEGGAITYRDKNIGEKLSMIRNFGYNMDGQINLPGGNGKMSEFHAAMGICNLKYIDSVIQKRKSLYNLYDSLLSGCKGIQLQFLSNHLTPNYSYFPVLFHSDKYERVRDNIAEELEREGFNTRKYFYPIANDYGYMICSMEYTQQRETPIAAKVADSILCLPIFPELLQQSVEEICSIILSVLKS